MLAYLRDMCAASARETLALYGHTWGSLLVFIVPVASYWTITQYRRGGWRAVVNPPPDWSQILRDAGLSLAIGLLLFAVLFGVNFVRATYQAHKDVEEKASSLGKELEKLRAAHRRAPITFEFRHIAIGLTENDRVNVTLWLGVINRGPATILTNWRASLRFAGDKEVPLIPRSVKLGNHIKLYQGAAGSKEKPFQMVRGEEMLPQVTREPIATGDWAEGVLMGLLEGLSQDESVKYEAIVVRCRDAYGNNHQGVLVPPRK